MSARLRVSSRCAERGVAVIMAMLTVALVAALAASVVAAFGFAVDSLSGRHDLAQARLLARGAVDWARNVLADDRRRGGEVDYLGEAWATKVPATPVDEGEVSGEIEDLSGRFNINNLVTPNGTVNKDGVDSFVRLLNMLAVNPSQAKQLTTNLTAWIDAEVNDSKVYDPPLSSGSTKPPNAPLASPDELSNVPGFESGLVERLQPYLAALPSDSVLNVNTASAEVMSAWLPKLPLAQARALVSGRSSRAFQNLDEFHNQSRLSAADAPPSRVAVFSRFFLASGRAKFGTATTRMQVLLDRTNKANYWPEIIWQKIL